MTSRVKGTRNPRTLVVLWCLASALATPGEAAAQAGAWAMVRGSLPAVSGTARFPDALRVDYAAVLLKDGRILFTGGRGFSSKKALATTELWDPTTDRGQPGPPMLGARRRHTAILLGDGRVLVAGGTLDENGKSLQTAEIWSPRLGTWTRSGDMHEPRTGHHALHLQNGSVMVVGDNQTSGGGCTLTVETWDPGTGNWTPSRPPALPRCGGAASILRDGRVVVVGGITRGQCTATAELWDQRTQAWSPLRPMSLPRCDPFAVALPDGRLMLGSGTAYPFLGNTEIWDPRTGDWTATGSMVGGGGYRDAATLLDDGTVMAIGPSAEGTLLVAEIWSSVSSAWRQVEPPLYSVVTSGPPIGLPDGRVFAGWMLWNPKARPAGTWREAGRVGLPTDSVSTSLLRDGRILVLGERGRETAEEGHKGTGLGTANRSGYAVDPQSGGFVRIADMITGRGDHSATVLQSGEVLVAGGARNGRTFKQRIESLDAKTSRDLGGLVEAEIWNPASGKWRPTGSMNEAREAFPALLLADGRVLAAGGEYYQFDPPIVHTFIDPRDGRQHRTSISELRGPIPMRSAEVWSPVTGRWSPTTPMGHPRRGHRATRLADGRVLVTGGDLDASGTTEIWDPATGRWSPAARMGMARSRHVAVLLRDGRVLVAGGAPHFTGNAMDTAEIWDPIKNEWTPTAAMLGPREHPSAALLPDGRVMIAGGGIRPEVWDPATGTWTPTGAPRGDTSTDIIVQTAQGRPVIIGNTIQTWTP